MRHLARRRASPVAAGSEGPSGYTEHDLVEEATRQDGGWKLQQKRTYKPRLLVHRMLCVTASGVVSVSSSMYSCLRRMLHNARARQKSRVVRMQSNTRVPASYLPFKIRDGLWPLQGCRETQILGHELCHNAQKIVSFRINKVVAAQCQGAPQTCGSDLQLPRVLSAARLS